MFSLPLQIGSNGAQNDKSFYYTDKADLRISYFPKNGIVGMKKTALIHF